MHCDSRRGDCRQDKFGWGSDGICRKQTSQKESGWETNGDFGAIRI